MKIVTQNFKTGNLAILDCPSPKLNPDSILVRTTASLISSGTERAVIGMAKKNYLGKALARPDLVRKVFNKIKSDGLWNTYKVVQNLISEPLTLGYSLAGEVIAIGNNIHEIKLGDRVACAGLGYANHAEIVCIPKNLFVKIPAEVSDEAASYVTLGAIAMHGIRQAQQEFGSIVLVLGLGLVGQITAQLCLAAGYQVIGLDVDPQKLELAKKLGVKFTLTPDDPNLNTTIQKITNGYGVDAVLLTAASNQENIFEEIARYCRDRAKIVVVGDVKMNISRRTYFNKELEILQSRSYGPGRYDPSYETQGHDYPIGYVRWTENRNMLAFLNLLADKKINLDLLTTHRFNIDQAEAAYKLVADPKCRIISGNYFKLS